MLQKIRFFDNKDPKLSLSELLSGWQYSNLFIWPSMWTRLEHAHCLETINNMWFLFVCTRHEEESSLLILVDAIHFLKHCPLVSVADKRYIYLFPFQFITWTACFPGSDTGRIEMRFLSTVPWCLLQLSNHSPFIKHMFYYLSRLLCWIRNGENRNTILKHRPLVSPPAK